MTLWPRNTNRASYMMMGLLVFSGTVCLAYTFVLDPIDPSADTGFRRWFMLAGLTVLGVVAKIAFNSIMRAFEQLGKRLDGVSEEMGEIRRDQMDFVMGLTNVLIDLTPDKAGMIHKRMNGLLKERMRAASAGGD